MPKWDCNIVAKICNFEDGKDIFSPVWEAVEIFGGILVDEEISSSLNPLL